MGSHTLFPLAEIDPGTARKVTIGTRQITIVRIENDVYAIGDTCSHDEVSLSEGYVDVDECMIECGRHGALFDLRTGEPASLPATRPVPVYDVVVVDGQVQLVVPDSDGNDATGDGTDAEAGRDDRSATSGGQHG